MDNTCENWVLKPKTYKAFGFLMYSGKERKGKEN